MYSQQLSSRRQTKKKDMPLAGFLYSYGFSAPDTLTRAASTSSIDSVWSLAASKIRPPQMVAFSTALTYRSARSSVWMTANLPPGWPGYQTVPSDADWKKGARSEPERPYKREGRITIPLRLTSLMTCCSRPGRHATNSFVGLMGVVSVTISLRLSPCTQVPEV